MGRYPIPDEENAKLAVPYLPLSEYKHVYSTPGGPTVCMYPVGELTQDRIDRLIRLNIEVALQQGEKLRKSAANKKKTEKGDCYGPLPDPG